MKNDTNKRIFSKILKTPSSSSKSKDIQFADSFIDESIDHLIHEEPSLAKWLEEDPELTKLFTVNITAIYQSLIEDSLKGRPLSITMGMMNALIFRLTCAVAWRAAIRERSLDMEIGKDIKNG